MGPRTVFMAEESMRYLLIAIFDRPMQFSRRCQLDEQVERKIERRDG